MERTFSVILDDETWVGERIDRYLAEGLGIGSRSQIKARIAALSVNGTDAKLSRILVHGDTINATIRDPQTPVYAPKEMDLTVLYEDHSVLVVEKEAGVVVHPGAGHHDQTLIQGVMFRRLEMAGAFEDGTRPGVVHRLDKDTSGVIIVAKTPEALAQLADQFQKRETKKTYLTIVHGRPRKRTGVIDARIGRDPKHRQRFTVVSEGGKRAKTTYHVVRSWGDYSLIAASPVTGRTHQIRVHLLSIGCPVIGDTVYGRKADNLPEIGLALHAYMLGITLPGEKTPTLFRTRFPQRFRRVIDELNRRPSRRTKG